MTTPLRLHLRPVRRLFRAPMPLDNPLARRSDYLTKSDLALTKTRLAEAGRAADSAAAAGAFARYQLRKSASTLRRQTADLRRFAAYLAAAGAPIAGDLASEPASWAGLTWGLVEGFVAWMLDQGDALGSVNVRLSTVKTYAKLAAQAGELDAGQLAQIQLVKGFRQGETRRVDAARETTRRGAKKATWSRLGPDQVAALRAASTDPRDQLMLGLLLDLGLRVGEVSLIEAEGFDLDRGLVRFYRPKVQKTQTHRLTPDAVAAARTLLANGATGTLFPGERRLRTRIGQLGRLAGVASLSPHDLRHAWATRVGRSKKTTLKAFVEAGGWNSPAMALRYQDDAQIANEGVELDD